LAPPRERFRNQLQILLDMGFPNEEVIKLSPNILYLFKSVSVHEFKYSFFFFFEKKKTKANLEALVATGGNVQAAVERLLGA
jgi:hypothetical protein